MQFLKNMQTVSDGAESKRKCYGKWMELPILYEDDGVVAVNKPAGLLTHSSAHTSGETAEDWFNATYPGASSVSDPETKTRGYVHRLDRDTSGVLVFAKNEKAYASLRKSFHDREVEKTYLAFVYGVPKVKKGSIDFDIGRSRKDFRLRSAQPKAKGRLREALTEYEVLGDIGTHALVRLHPKTGRTHQIRVHLKAIHHPIVGDPLYAPNQPKALGITRLGLHAYQVDLPLPQGGRTIITATLPDDLAPAFANFPKTSEKLLLG